MAVVNNRAGDGGILRGGHADDFFRPAVPMPAGRLGPGPPPSRCLLCSPSFGFVDAVATEFVAISESLPSALQSSICQLAGPGPMIEILRSGAGRRKAAVTVLRGIISVTGCLFDAGHVYKKQASAAP